MCRKACHKKEPENPARTLLGGLAKCAESLPQREPCQDVARAIFKNVPESLPQRELCQDLARRTFKMLRKACHKENRARNLLGGPSVCRRACHKENRARNLLEGLAKCA